MALYSPRDLGREDKENTGWRNAVRRACPALALALASCVSYEPAPLDVSEVLRDLEAREWVSSELPDSPTADGGFRPAELAAFAVTANPRLSALRADVGVGRALLVEAGLLPDPELGWDAMDVLASRIVDGTSDSVDALSGLGLMFPLQRPGERDARVGAAEWSVEETRRRVAKAEWDLARDVYVASEEVHAARQLLAQTRTLVEVGESTNDYFRRAREAGTATGIQANLALGELQAIRLEEVRAEARARQARQDLNVLLGLPPDHPLEVFVEAADPSEHALLSRSPEELTRHAVLRRPDLAELEARYRGAEESVRLAVARQYPMVSIGTGISLEFPVFSRWGRPAIDTAIARREQVSRELAAAVHQARAEIAAAHTQWQFADRELALIESELLPNAEQSLELAQESFRQGEVTPLETLALLTALVEARTRHTEVGAQRRKRAWSLLAASGLLLHAPENETDDDEEDSQ